MKRLRESATPPDRAATGGCARAEIGEADCGLLLDAKETRMRRSVQGKLCFALLVGLLGCSGGAGGAGAGDAVADGALHDGPPTGEVDTGAAGSDDGPGAPDGPVDRPDTVGSDGRDLTAPDDAGSGDAEAGGGLGDIPRADAHDAETTSSDGSSSDTGVGEVTDTVDAGPPAPPFPRDLPPADALGESTGLLVSRTIVHLHSVFSHDACDNAPIDAEGRPNEACLQDLRDALCTDRVDFAMMTEHQAFMAETPAFEELFLHRDGDTWVDEDGHHSASVLHCADGHAVHIMPGLESSSSGISPIGLTGHPVDGTIEEIATAYRDGSPEGIARFREQSGVPVAIHLEDRSVEWLVATAVDTLEIGNLHVLIAPNYRQTLGLDPGKPGLAFFDYLLHPDERPAGDLVFLEFHERLPLYFDRWDQVLAQRMVAGFAGNDVHRNVLDSPLGDGERPDSYRRMMKWYVNYLLVAERTPAAARRALAGGQTWGVYEVLGSPVGFAFWAQRGDDPAPTVVGQSLNLAEAPDGVRLRASLPQPLVGTTLGEAPVQLRLVRATAEGGEIVTEADAAIDYPVTAPGRYRIEIDITPTHLAPFLVARPELVHPYPWMFSNPIDIR